MKFTIIAILALFPLLSNAKEAQGIIADSIGSDYILIGKLGVPLGTISRASGWISYETDPDYSGTQFPAFHITKIDGKTLDKEIIIRYFDAKRPKIGKFENELVVEEAIYEFSGRQSLKTTLKFAEQGAAANP